MWSFSRLTVETILRAVLRRVDSMARRTLARSICILDGILYAVGKGLGREPWKGSGIPFSVRGEARVTSSVHCSQHTISSPLANHVIFFRFFSKNCTTTWPLTPELRAPISVLVSSCRSNSAVFCSIKVSSSASSTTGKLRSRTSRVVGRMEGKKRWKNMVCRTPGSD